MAENPKEWPRCHTCLYSWCPQQSDECKRCDTVLAILKADREPPEAAFDNVDDLLAHLNGS